jgi:hypothetical protein
MLNKAFEWCRIINIQPTKETVDNRIAASRDILKVLDDAGSRDLVLACTVGVVAGFEMNFSETSPIVKTIVDAVVAHDSAFPRDIGENALELRACAGIVLGEMLAREGAGGFDKTALWVASALRSGFGMRPSPGAKYLKQLVEDLETAATRVLSTRARTERQPIYRVEELYKALDLVPADLSTMSESVMKPLKSALKQIERRSAIDQEELNILWWMFAGPTTPAGQPIAQLPVGVAVLSCGAHLGSTGLLPALPSHEAMVRRAYEAGRGPHDLTDRSLEQVVGDWTEPILNALVPDEDARALARDYPALFPLSWLCTRILASRGAASWANEFERLTGLPAQNAHPPANWAVQVFHERIAQRIFRG